MTIALEMPRTVRGIELASRVIAIASTCLLMGVTVIDVVLRSTTGRGIPGAIEITEVFLVVAAYLGMMTAARDGMHISATLVTDRLPVRVARVTRTIGSVISALILLALIYATSARALVSLGAGEFRFGLVSVPIWPARIAIVVGLCGLVVAIVLQLAQQLMRSPRDVAA
ncbi:MAG TPA: TRAP transporter small permease [Microbacteriaceae bacterium]|nr:TRAP transporter small permease [Microbacteriaceae bacterium]